MIGPFVFSSTPRLTFGVGKINTLSSEVRRFGRKLLLVKGGSSFDNNHGKGILHSLDKNGLIVRSVSIPIEPTPSIIDEAVSAFRTYSPDVVVSVGGGSVLDAGKAIAAMLAVQGTVREYLEGVGTKTHSGAKIPFIAVPTTAGTGSEATKNAVISEVGINGFKRSLRHDNFVPDAAIIDPELAISCPSQVTAASGMDAFTQLLESYLSSSASPITDALALHGLECISRSLLKAYRDPTDIGARTDMALAAYLSGMTLANAGLGLVHGYASSVGARFDIPHGIVCSSLMLSANEITLNKLKETKHEAALVKFRRAGLIMNAPGASPEERLLEFIRLCRQEMGIPRLSAFGIADNDIGELAAKTDNKNNPVVLDAREREMVLRMAL